ncbi:hypothetical protein JEZ13_05985 [bacterium]|nr:hypothetical protein [bacterium]
MKRAYILIVAILFMVGCSSVKQLSEKQKEKLARTNLAYLNNFNSRGVVDISVKGFSLKKEFFLKKNSKSLRLDILDSGIMSLLPSPFASLYVEDKILVTNYNKGFFPDLVSEQFPVNQFLDLEKLPQGIIDEIIKNRKFTIAIIQFEFDEKYRLHQIIMNENKTTFEYQNNDLYRINFLSPKAEVKFDFDSFETGDVLIKPVELKNKID